ncbi:AsmA family protein [Pseudoalteromonas luteoviolacea]|uniref:AsmA family protein n=1 Tax=Pseudoalteromonas luteoviolacea TaxID=43657 RepID=UPI00115242A9|nr:AsmA family protein [Pseudoalteromonas luteoviolacea]TQF72752.1 AsmA family protein [Pseudoalteromonas luteoviolacea]
MKAILKGVVGIVVLLVALLILAPLLIPTDTIVSQITSQVEKTTGRTLRIAGDSELSVFPKLNITLNNVEFANMPSGSQSNMLTMEQLAVNIPWVSLLSGEFKLERFVINNPRVLLEVDAAGKPNWQLFPTTPEQPAEQGSTDKSSSSTQLPSGFDIALGEVAIYGGSVIYQDAQSGTTEEITDLDLSVMLPSLYQALTIDGAITYQAQRFEIEMKVDNPAKAIQSEDFKFSKVLRNQLVNIDFNGEVVDGAKRFKGELLLAGDSVKALTQWQNVPLEAQENAFNQFEVKGSMQFADNVFRLDSFSASLDELQITGNATVDLKSRIAISADVDLGMLDVNPYLPEPATTTEQPPVPEDNAPPQPIVWDDSEIDLSALNQLDANLVVRSTGFKARKITLGENQLSVRLQQGKARVSLDKFNAYEGDGNGVITVNAVAKPYRIETNFKLRGINAQPLLSDAIDFDKVLGKGSINWSLQTQGMSQKQFISKLGGKLAFEFKDGGVKGANLAEMVRKGQEMLKGNFSGLSEGINADFDPEQKTDFSALTGSFNFTNGAGTNSNLLLASPLIRVTGSGTVDLPKTFIDYRLVTGIVDTIEGQSSQDKSTGFKIPARIKGPFHQVETSLDFSGAAKDKAKDAIKDKLKDKFKGLFGG